ncbi:hypothetical protein GEMRC1_002175 [Eukaryota sp. GEM-RC1]
MFDHELWKKSGHWQFYKDDMFVLNVDEKEWALKPMNCPGHCVLFGHQRRSYRELPFRCAEFGVLHRNEASGALSGLSRVRRFVQDDAHIFCRRDQIYDEIMGVIKFVEEVYNVLQMPVEFVLSTRPEKFLGDLYMWNEAEVQLKRCLADCGKEFAIDEGGGAFYGSKIDINVTDALKRRHQCATIQLDFNLPERFELQYDGENGPERPVMIHRAILGSLERFMAMALEHLAVCIVPVSHKFNDYAQEVYELLRSHRFYVDAELSGLQLKRKIRDAQIEQYNFILVVGADEAEKKTVNVRTRDSEDKYELSLDAVVEMFNGLERDFK